MNFAHFWVITLVENDFILDQVLDWVLPSESLLESCQGIVISKAQQQKRIQNKRMENGMEWNVMRCHEMQFNQEFNTMECIMECLY